MNKRFLSNSKGMSEIVTTVIIVVLVLVAIGIVWVVINNLLGSSTEEAELNTKCINVDIQATAVRNTTIVDATPPTSYDITLEKTRGDEVLDGVKIVFYNATSGIAEIQDYIGDISGLIGTTTSITATSVIYANKIEITPFFLNDKGEERLCSQTTSYSF